MGFSFKSKLSQMAKSIKKSAKTNADTSKQIFQLLENSHLTTRPLEEMAFIDTGEYRFLLKQRVDQPFLLNSIKEFQQKYDLMIVIPAYNAEQYIADCIESILSQTTEYTYEIVIVNDGSSDNTATVLKQYENYDNVRIINQKNMGVAGARNTALSLITGKYIMWLDSDDVLKDGAIQSLLTLALKNKAEIVEGSYIRFNDEGDFNPVLHHDENSIDNPKLVLFGFPWGKVIQSELFDDIAFPEGYIYEDSIFAYCIHPKANLRYTVSDIFYKYRVNPEGICATAAKTKQAVDTYFVSFHLWKYYYEHFPQSEYFSKKVRDQIILNYGRTAHLDEEVLRNAFKLTQRMYVSVIESPLSTRDRYGALDMCMRKGDYETFCRIYQIWYNWK